MRRPHGLDEGAADIARRSGVSVCTERISGVASDAEPRAGRGGWKSSVATRGGIVERSSHDRHHSVRPRTRPRCRAGSLPSRRLHVLLGCLYLVLFGGLLAAGGDRSPADDPTKLIAGYTLGDVTVQLMTYATMIAAALLIFYGAGLRLVLSSRTHRWTADAAFIGFVTMAWTIAGFAVTSLALHHAVASGDTTSSERSTSSTPRTSHPP